MTASTEVT